MILRRIVFLFILFWICVKPEMAYEDEDEDSSGDEDEEDYFDEYYEEDYEDDENFSRKVGRNVREENTIGSVLFGQFGHLKKCFSQEDIALLSARKEFEVRFFFNVKTCLIEPF